MRRALATDDNGRPPEGAIRQEEGKMADEMNGRVDRRGFLGLFGLGAGAAAAATATAVGVVPAEAEETKDEKVKSRYRVTDHVKAYYKVNRY